MKEQLIQSRKTRRKVICEIAVLQEKTLKFICFLKVIVHSKLFIFIVSVVSFNVIVIFLYWNSKGFNGYCGVSIPSSHLGDWMET